LLVDFGLDGLQFLDATFEFALFGAGSFLLCLGLLLGLLQVVGQLRLHLFAIGEFGYEPGAVFSGGAGLQLSALPGPRLLGQRSRQAFDSLEDVGLRRL